jgi:hypothetical protein
MDLIHEFSLECPLGEFSTASLKLFLLSTGPREVAPDNASLLTDELAVAGQHFCSCRSRRIPVIK